MDPNLATATFNNRTLESDAVEKLAGLFPVSRIGLMRKYSGELAGESIAELLVCQTGDVKFGYVGVDRFTGRLGSRSGTFVYQHGGFREAGELRPFGYIVPGSGTDDLVGIRGSVTIAVTESGEHSIELNYEFDR